MKNSAFATIGILALAITSLTASGQTPQEKWAFTDITFKAEVDGSEQHYVLGLPEGFAPDQGRDLMVALHGHGSDRWQYAQNPREECRSARDMAWEKGMVFVSPDYRAATSWMGPAAEADLIQIIREVQAQYGTRRTFLCGGSMGATSALTFTALHPDLIAGVAALNGTANHLEYQNFQDAIQASFGGTKQAIPQEYKKRSAEYWPECFTMPVGLTTGGKDDIVPPQSVMRLAAILETLARPVKLIHRPEGGHETNYTDSKDVLLFVIDHAQPNPASK